MNIKTELKAIKKFIPIITEQSYKYSVDKNVLLSIAILENINRPFWVRMWEKTVCKFLPIKTFGLMQVLSEKYVDDKESIEIATRHISKLNYKNNLIRLGELYNGSKEYGKCLDYIYGEVGCLAIK